MKCQKELEIIYFTCFLQIGLCCKRIHKTDTARINNKDKVQNYKTISKQYMFLILSRIFGQLKRSESAFSLRCYRNNSNRRTRFLLTAVTSHFRNSVSVGSCISLRVNSITQKAPVTSSCCPKNPTDVFFSLCIFLQDKLFQNQILRLNMPSSFGRIKTCTVLAVS